MTAHIDTYSKLWRAGIHRVALWLVIGALVALFAYLLSQSILVAVVAALCVGVFRRLFFAGPLRERRRQIDLIFGDRFARTTGRPLVDREAKDWLKGIGYIDDLSQPVWVRVEADGILLYYLCHARLPPLLVSWMDIQSLVTTHSSEPEERLITLFVSGIDSSVELPWCSSFDDVIPDRVGLVTKARHDPS